MLKYIIIREGDGPEIPMFTLVPITHRELMKYILASKPRAAAVSAGFVEWVQGEARTYGRSESLDIGPRPEDAKFFTVFARQTAAAAAASMNMPCIHGARA